MAHDVFISYSSKDKPTADAVCATLEARQIRCWIAPRDVLPGQNYAGQLVNAINEADALVLVFSSSTNSSSHVMREVERAATRNMPILPFRIEDVPFSADMDYYIGTTHWLDAFTPPLDKHLGQLADSLERLLARTGKAARAAEEKARQEAEARAAELERARAEAEDRARAAKEAEVRAAELEQALAEAKAEAKKRAAAEEQAKASKEAEARTGAAGARSQEDRASRTKSAWLTPKRLIPLVVGLLAVIAVAVLVPVLMGRSGQGIAAATTTTEATTTAEATTTTEAITTAEATTTSEATTSTEATTTTVALAVPQAVWTELDPGGEQPPARTGQAMAYDSYNGKVVMFGGTGESGFINDTWVYDSTSNTWTEAQPQGAVPSARTNAEMVYAMQSQCLIMFGGQTMSSTGRSDELWRYDLGDSQWTKLEPQGARPSARFAAGMAYDWEHHVVIMVGGVTLEDGVATVLNDTWAYDPVDNSWTELFPQGEIPTSRGGQVVWDQDTGKVITFAGGGPDAPFVDDTWTFDSDSAAWSWEGLAETVPNSRGSVALDGGSGRVVMFGGVAYGTLYNETWVYDLATNTWTELETVGTPPSARKAPGCVYDGSLGQIIMFGGYNTSYLADTWALSLE